MVARINLARVEFVASAKRDLAGMPEKVKSVFGFAIFKAQAGDKHPQAKPLRGFRGAGVLEIVEDHDGDTYRCVYTIRFREALYVLDAFQKKSKSGIKTPKMDIDRLQGRLKAAERHYADHYKKD